MVLAGLTGPWPRLAHARPSWVSQGELVLALPGRDLTRRVWPWLLPILAKTWQGLGHDWPGQILALAGMALADS